MSCGDTQYDKQYQQSITNPEQYWEQVSQVVDWYKSPSQILSTDSAPFYRWFKDGMLNTCYNAVDRHVEAGFGAQIAIIHDSPITNSKRTISYAQLQEMVARLAGVLLSHGVGKGDRVIIYMPMVPEAVVAMLACARIGAVHSVVFGGFASKELATRIDDAQPKMILSASCGIEPGRVIDYKSLLDQARAFAAHKVDGTLILQREQQPCTLGDDDWDWAEAVSQAEQAACVPLEADHPLYILYTSGTTGRPKGIVRDNGGHAVAMCWSMGAIYNVKPGEVFWAASDVGWVVGHSYIVYAPLLNRNTTIIFEGKPVGTPDAGAFWRVIEEHKVSTLFTAPTALRAIKKEDPAGELLKQYDISAMRALFLAGERSDPDTIHWSQRHLKVSVVDHWWQTETSWAIAGNPLGLADFPIKAGSVTKPIPGYDIQILDDSGQQVAAESLGNIAVKLPLPPGTMLTVWGDDERFVNTYLSQYPGYYLTGDSGMLDEDGYVYVMSRIDDVINVAGHRLSTGQMEEVLCNHPLVAEAAVFGVHDALKGELPLGLVVLNMNAGVQSTEVVAELIKLMRDTIGAVSAFKLCAVVVRLPKTRSGKILRGTMRAIANGDDWNMPATIDDPAILDEITAALKALGYPPS